MLHDLFIIIFCAQEINFLITCKIDHGSDQGSDNPVFWFSIHIGAKNIQMVYVYSEQVYTCPLK
jgi:hypothetical protein